MKAGMPGPPESVPGGGGATLPIARGLGRFLIRAMLGVVFLFHGAQKLFGAFGGHAGKGFDVTQGGMEHPLTLFAVLAGLLLTGPARCR